MLTRSPRLRRGPRVASIPGSGGYEWSISGPADSVARGASAAWRITLDRNGVTPGGQVSIKVRTPSEAEFAALHPATTQALNTSFTRSYIDVLRAAVLATPGGVSVVPKSPGVLLTFNDALWNGILDFTRVTSSDPAIVGARLSSMIISDPSHGTIVTGEDSFIILAGSAPAGPLTDVLLGDGGMVYVPWSMTPTPGVEIGSFAPVGGTIVSAAFAASDNAGGRVALDGADGLVVGATAPNFGASDQARTVYTGPYHEPNMRVTVDFEGGLGEEVQKVYTLWPSFPKIDPTGGAGGTTIIVSTLAELQNEMRRPTTDPRIIRINPAVSGVWETNSNQLLFDVNGKKNWSLVGHRGVILKDSNPLITYAENFIIANLAVRPGADPLGVTRSNRDGMTQRGGVDGKWMNCDFSWPSDEAGSLLAGLGAIGPVLRRNLFYRCAWYAPLQNAGHTDPGENSHPYGLLIYPDSQQTWIIENVFLDNWIRNALVKSRLSYVQQNCLVARYSIGGGGSGIQTTSIASGVEDDNRLTALIRGNLLNPPPWGNFSADAISRGIATSQLGSGGHIYLPPAAHPEANVSFRYPNDPAAEKVRFDRSRVKVRSGTLASYVEYEPFQVGGFPCRPTETDDDIEDLFGLLVGEFDCVTGCRAFDGDGDPLVDDPIPGWNSMTSIGKAYYRAYVTGDYSGVPGGKANPNGGYLTAPSAGGTYNQADDDVWDAYDTGVPA